MKNKKNLVLLLTILILTLILDIRTTISAEIYKSSNYRINIANHDQPTVHGYNEHFSIIIGSGTITVTNPVNYTYWEPGSTQVITWTSTGNISDVDIDIYKGNTSKYSIPGEPNIGNYVWTINETIELGLDWGIKISNSDNSSEYGWSDYFAIVVSYGDPIPGYNLFIIISVICLVSMLYTRKRIKKRI